MMGTGNDPGKIMGRLWADAPGPRVSASAAARLGSQTPAGARADRAANTLTFTGPAVRADRARQSPREGVTRRSGSLA